MHCTQPEIQDQDPITRKKQSKKQSKNKRAARNKHKPLPAGSILLAPLATHRKGQLLPLRLTPTLLRRGFIPDIPQQGHIGELFQVMHAVGFQG